MRFLGRVGMGGDKHHGNVAGGFIRLELGADFKAIHAWHHHIEQHQVRRVAFADAKGLRATGCHEHLAFPGKRLVHDLDVDGLVIHHQQFGFAMGVVEQINEG